MSLAETLRSLVAAAPAHVLTLSVVAIAISGIGLILSAWHSANYLLAARAIARVPAECEGAAFGGLLRVLDSFGSRVQPLTPLSRDAAWEFVTARLHFDFESYRAQVRFLAYLPLLVGLAATMLGLASLTDQLGSVRE